MEDDRRSFNGRTFDRVARWDDQNNRFLVRNTVEGLTPPSSKTRKRVVWLDQGTEGGCTGYSAATCLSLAPHVHSDVVNANAEYLYSLAKDYDQWPGRNYQGSSVLGAMQGCKAKGYVTSYLWATTVEEIVQALAFHGPVIFGINWYQSMFDVDPSSGLIRITGSAIAGGHAITASGYKNGGDLILLDNSWGKGWGSNGNAWISAADISRLLSEQGECAVPVKANPMPMLGTSPRVDP